MAVFLCMDDLSRLYIYLRKEDTWEEWKLRRMFEQVWFMIAIYILLGTIIIFMFQLIMPSLSGAYQFLKVVLTPFIVAMIISYILNPIVNLLSERRVPRTLAVLLIYALFLVSLVVITMNLIPVFIKQLRELNEHLPELTSKVKMFVDGVHQNKQIPFGIREAFGRALMQLEITINESVSDFVQEIGSTIGFIFIIMIVPFVAFYMLKDFKLIEKTVLTMIPKTHRKGTLKLLFDIDRALGNYIRGQFIVCMVIGLLAYIGYWIIDLPYPLLLASGVAIFNIIPYVGPFFGAAPAFIMASAVSVKMMLLVIVVNVTVQMLEGNLVSPQVVGKSMNMHPLLIIFALLVGGEIAGIVGLILAVPVFAVLKVILQHLYLYFVNRKVKI